MVGSFGRIALPFRPTTRYAAWSQNLSLFCQIPSVSSEKLTLPRLARCILSRLGGGATQSLPKDGGVEELHGDPTVGPRPKVWTRGQKLKWCRRWCVREPRMRDSQGGGESDPAEGVCRCWMKNSRSFLSCIGKRTKKGCDRGSEVETI